MDSLCLVVPTRNRADLWRNGRVLESLLNQSDKGFELIIVDDDSTDGTLDVLREELRGILEPWVRLFSCQPHGDCPTRASVIPDQVGFRHAEGAILAHSDDDVILDKDFVAHCRRWFAEHGPSVVYGGLVFVDPNNPERVLQEDPRFRHLGNGQAVARLEPDWKAERGSIYAALRHDLLALGGHDMRYSNSRGADTRLGKRLRRCLPTYFNAHAPFIGQHLGLHFYMRQLMTANVAEMYAARRSPLDPPPDADPPLVANGGLSFWRSEQAIALAEEINL